MLLKLREARERAGMTQRDLASRLSCSDALVSRYESGSVQVPPERVASLLDALGLQGEERAAVLMEIVPAGYRVGA